MIKLINEEKLNESFYIGTNTYNGGICFEIEGWGLPNKVKDLFLQALTQGEAFGLVEVLCENGDMPVIDTQKDLDKVDFTLAKLDSRDMHLITLYLDQVTHNNTKGLEADITFSMVSRNSNKSVEQIVGRSDIESIEYVGGFTLPIDSRMWMYYMPEISDGGNFPEDYDVDTLKDPDNMAKFLQHLLNTYLKKYV